MLVLHFLRTRSSVHNTLVGVFTTAGNSSSRGPIALFRPLRALCSCTSPSTHAFVHIIKNKILRKIVLLWDSSSNWVKQWLWVQGCGGHPCSIGSIAFFVVLYYFIGILPTCIFVYLFHAGPTEVRGGHWILWNWGWRQLWSAIWVLGVKTGSPGRAATALNCWAVPPVLQQ